MKQGFTLTEIVIAAAILAISLAMIIGILVTFRRSTYLASYRMEALHQARDHIETLLSHTYNDTQLNIGTYSFAVTNDSLSYVYTVSSNAAFSGVKDISLTVNWVNPSATITSSVTIISSMSSVLHE